MSVFNGHENVSNNQIDSIIR